MSTAPTCKTCGGSGEATPGYLDCAAPGCTAAVERVALHAKTNQLPLMTLDDAVWWAYQEGKKARAEADAAQLKAMTDALRTCRCEAYNNNDCISFDAADKALRDVR